MLGGASRSEGVTGRSPLWTRRSQRVSLGTAACRVSRWLTLGIDDFLSWSQRDAIPIFRQKLHNSSTTQTVYQAGATPGSGRFRGGQGAPDRPNSLLSYKERGKGQVVLIHCSWSTPAGSSCSLRKNTTLAGSGIARDGGGGCTTTTSWKL